MKLEVGKNYKTRGGWKAKVIWIVQRPQGFPWAWVIHRPGEQFESEAMRHQADGAYFVGAESMYLEEHPADLIAVWPEA